MCFSYTLLNPGGPIQRAFFGEECPEATINPSLPSAIDLDVFVFVSQKKRLLSRVHCETKSPFRSKQSSDFTTFYSEILRYDEEKTEPLSNFDGQFNIFSAVGVSCQNVSHENIHT